MNALTLSLASIRNRGLQSALCMLAVACGVALLTCVFLLFSSAERGLMRNADGIDMVVGAKGSPLQLVLSTIYHSDIPNGNIEMADMERLKKNPQIKSIIPLAIGDNYKGWRIVGSTPAYVSLYKGEAATGKIFENEYEAVVGSDTNLALGETFAARHGFSADSDDVHDDHLYTVTGRLKPTGTIIDKLIVTPYESVQDLHSHPHADDPDAAEEAQLGHQITALLIKVRSPAALMNLPRDINRSSNLLAASPGHTMARFMKSTGMGRDVLEAIGYVFLFLAALMLLSVLTSGLAERRYDLAVLRVLGAPASTLAATVVAEGLLLSLTGAIAGVVIGHALAFILGATLPAFHTLIIPETLLMPISLDAVFILTGTLCGLVASIIPCILAARTDIAGILAQRK